MNTGESLDNRPSTSADAMARNLILNQFKTSSKMVPNTAAIMTNQSEEEIMVKNKQCDPPDMTCTVIIGGIKQKCDLRLLQRCCEHFRKGVSGMVFVLPVRHVNCRAFCILYSWVRQRDLNVAPKDLMPLYMAANFLGVRSLSDQFMDMFSNPHVAREEIGFHVYYGLTKWNIHGLYRSMLHRVHKYFLTMITTPQFFELDGNAVMTLLNSTSICINSEVEVLLAGMFWLLHDYNSRRDWMTRIFSCVRYSCIPGTAIEDLRLNSSSNGVTTLLYHPKLEELFERSRHITNYNIQYTNRRIWIYDELSCYHHDAKCPKRNHISLAQFLHYQHVLSVAPSLHWYDRLSLNPYARKCHNPQCSDLSKQQT